MRGSWAALLATAALAGCFGGGSPQGSGDGDAGPPADDGSVAGVVVSPAIVPLSGVSLRLEPAGLDATTDAEGRFSFDGLRGGSYTLVATLEGYLPATTVAEPGPAVVQVVLEPDRQVGSYVESYTFDGFLQWSFNVGGARSANSVSPNYTIGVRPPDWIQSELVWESTQALGNTLDLTAIANDGGVTVPDFARSIGPSPLLMTINSSVILEYRLGPGVLLDFSIFAGEEPNPAGRGAGLALSQSYRLVTHMFYGYLPPEGWRFTADGEPPAPPA
jgi:hypothetical protein